MSQPKMIVLSLIGIGLRYGFEMEDFARRTNLRQWARIGMSTIYKTLNDLEREGAVSAAVEESDKGPRRKAYALTDVGRKRMAALIAEALASNMSVYSERIAGLAFAPLMEPRSAKAAIARSIEGLEQADAMLARSLESEGMDRIGSAVIEFYRAVHAAERTAMNKALAIIGSAGKSPGAG